MFLFFGEPDPSTTPPTSPRTFTRLRVTPCRYPCHLPSTPNPGFQLTEYDQHLFQRLDKRVVFLAWLPPHRLTNKPVTDLARPKRLASLQVIHQIGDGAVYRVENYQVTRLCFRHELMPCRTSGSREAAVSVILVPANLLPLLTTEPLLDLVLLGREGLIFGTGSLINPDHSLTLCMTGCNLLIIRLRSPWTVKKRPFSSIVSAIT